jgi:NADH:ubiquinone reductase (H+-translocating)
MQPATPTVAPDTSPPPPEAALRPDTPDHPRVVIVGAGFGGLSAAMTLRGAPVHVSLLDRTNHHLFQPLLYQVATGLLSPADVAVPTRFLLRKQSNVTVLLADVDSVDLEQRLVMADEGALQVPYDFLIVAPGARHSYFGHDEWEPLAPGLKTLEDAREIRSRFLLAFEMAEKTVDPVEQEALLTFVVVGGGPTGVELAGILPTIARKGFREDFRNVDLSKVRVLLLEGGPQLIPAFPERLSRRACRDLESLGVTCRTNAMVSRVTDEAVYLGDERIPTRTVFWAAGNEASPLLARMGLQVDKSGRVAVLPDLSIPGRPEVFVVGDAAAVPVAGKDNVYVPGLAAAAKQMGAHAAHTIVRTIERQPRRTFRYRDRGLMAVVGRNRALALIGGRELTGRVAFWIWLLVHLMYLVGFRNRMSVLIEWGYAYFTYRPGARLVSDFSLPRAKRK